MNIGITYDLREDYLAQGYSNEETAEFDKIETIDAIDETLRSLGHTTRRIGNIYNLVRFLAAGERWDFVFNIAEGLNGIGREAQVPALLDAFKIPYTFSDPVVLGVALNKAMAKRIIRDLNIPTPNFCQIECIEDLEKVELRFPLFAKPLAEGTSKGISSSSIIYTKKEMIETCLVLLEKFRQPVLLEEFLPGREFTVGIAGTGIKAGVLGAVEIILHENAENNAYSFFNKANYQNIVTYNPVDDETAQLAKNIALSAWRGLGCRDCGRVDLRCDVSGVPNFIEVNPLAGLNPEISDLPILCRLHGVSFKELITAIMNSAFDRITEPLTPLKFA